MTSRLPSLLLAVTALAIVGQSDSTAESVAGRDRVPVIDLCGGMLPRLSELQRPGNVHFKPEGDRVLGEQVAAAIRSRLGG